MKSTVGGTTSIHVGNYYELVGGVPKKYYYTHGVRVAMRDNGALRFLLGDHPLQAQDRL